MNITTFFDEQHNSSPSFNLASAERPWIKLFLSSEINNDKAKTLSMEYNIMCEIIPPHATYKTYIEK